MAERKFDYNNVSTVYQNMKKITGDAGDGESIAGILHKIDEEVHNKVDVSEEAIFGDLGKQMLLDWDNTSANFDNFVTNFSNWSTLIAQSAGNYAQFEKDIAGFKQANPLGVTSGGITDAYTNTGYYSTYDQAYVDSAASLVGTFVSYNGLGYIDTNMVALEEQRKTNAKWAFGIQAVSTILSVVGLKGSGVFAGAAGATDDVARVAAGAADDVARAATSSIDDLVSKAPAVTKDKVAYVNKLIEDGTINNADDFLKFFGGSESTAKAAYTAANGGTGGSSIVRNILKGFTDDAAKTAATASGSASSSASVAASNSSIFSAARSKISSMSDDAIAKVMGLSKEQVDSIILDGGTVKQYALNSLKDTKVAQAFANFGTKTSEISSNLFSAAKTKISSMSDDAIAKVMGLSKEQVDSIILDGGTVKQYALNSLKDTRVVQAFANIGSKVSNSSVANSVRNLRIPSGTIPTAAGLGTNLVGENLLDDINYDNVAITSNPYVE